MRCAASRSARLLGVTSKQHPTTVRSHFRIRATRRHLLRTLPAVALLTACDSLPSSGPTASEIASAGRPGRPGGTRFAFVDVTADTVAIMQRWSAASLQGSFGRQRPAAKQLIGVGDYVQVVIWEAAAGGLFSAPANDRSGSGSRSAVIPEQVVGPDGALTVPYAGRVRVAGRSPAEVEQTIVQALRDKAIEPQVLVTVTRNVANTVTVIGEVTSGARVPLTTRGDRLLDVIAAAGGTRAAAHEIFVTLVRDGASVRIPMQAILNDPAENVYVQAGDVVSVARDPQTFTAAGATGINTVIPFDAVGITLEQALARAGGVNDVRADPAGVFVIRFERPADYDQLGLQRPDPSALPEVQVMRIEKASRGFFIARRFPVRNKDIVYVSNAPSMEIQKVMTILLPFLGAGATAVTVGAVTSR